MLRAVAAGRAELTGSCEPDLQVDGLPCCDQGAARDLAHAGLVRQSSASAPWQWAPAELTPEGHHVLAELSGLAHAA
jgi:hypothetical protein